MPVEVVRERRFEITERAMRQAKELGISLLDLRDIARRSLAAIHPEGNRRFGDLILQVQEKTIAGVTQVRETQWYRWAASCSLCRGSLQTWVAEEHDRCDGKGCPSCDGGFVSVRRPCPAFFAKEGKPCERWMT